MSMYDELKEAVAELTHLIDEAENTGFNHEGYAEVLEAGRIEAIDLAEAFHEVSEKHKAYRGHLLAAAEWEGYLADLEGTDAEKANAAHEQARWAVK